MGAGKEAPSKDGGDEGTGKTAAAAAAEPVVLGMVLHCNGCAKKVVKSIKHMPGVGSVVADAALNTVVVAGTADAAALKARIESKTRKHVEILSAGGGGGGAKPSPAEVPKKNPDKDGGGGEQKRSPDKGDKAGASQPQPLPLPREEEEKGKKQPPEEKKPVEVTTTTALLRIRLHCDSCADRIRRRIYKIKGVKDVVLEGNGKDEVQVVGTMDVAAMVVYLNDKLNRTVELAAASKIDKGGEETKNDKGGEKHKDKAAAAGGDNAHKGDKGKGIEVAGPSMASAAASMAPASAMASTHHVSPYGYGHVAYPPPTQGPPPGYYNSSYYGGGNADGAGYATPYYQQPRADATPYYQQPRADAGSYSHQPPSADNGSYYQHQPSADTSSYYQHPGGYGQDQHPNPQSYPAYPFDTAPPPQMFSDENPNSCSVM